MYKQLFYNNFFIFIFFNMYFIHQKSHMQTGFLSEYCKIELYGRKCQRTEITETKNPDESPGFPVITK